MVAWPGACRPETPCVGPTLGTIPSGPSHRLRRLQRSFTIHQVPPKPTGRDVIPIKKTGFRDRLEIAPQSFRIDGRLRVRRCGSGRTCRPYSDSHCNTLPIENMIARATKEKAKIASGSFKINLQPIESARTERTSGAQPPRPR
jgi:hypothetical protein